MTTELKTYARANKTLFVTLLLVLSMGVANAAFTPAPGTAPTCPSTTVGCNEPINTGTTGQNKQGGLSINGTSIQTPDTKASLDLLGTNKGLFMPRLTNANKASLGASGSTYRGLTIYNTDTKTIETYDGANWIMSATSSSVATGIDGPAFLANYTGANGAMAVTPYKVPFTDITYNTGSSFTTSAAGAASTHFNRFQPGVVGKYILSASLNIWVATTNGPTVTLVLKKNGTIISSAKRRVTASSGESYDNIDLTAVADVSLVGDYFELELNTTDLANTWIYSNLGTGISTAQISNFSASRVGGAVTYGTAPGATGPTGPIGVNWIGPWSAVTSYAVNAGVSYNGSSYVAKNANLNSAPPSANWNLVAQVGANGTNGTNGTNGVSGFSSFPIGSMMMWFGGPSVPSGWQYCDGNSNTPNMYGRFPFGTSYSGSGSVYSPGSNGGSATWNNIYPATNNPPNPSTSGAIGQTFVSGLGGGPYNTYGGRTHVTRQDWGSGNYSTTFTTGAPTNGFAAMQLLYFTGALGESSSPNNGGAYTLPNGYTTQITTMPPFAGVVFICKTS